MHTLDDTALLKLGLRHTTYAARAEVGVTRLNAAQAAQILVARLFPFCNQIGIGDLLLDAVVVEFTADCLAPIEQVVYVARLLMVHLEYGPQRFADTFTLVRVGFGWKWTTMRRRLLSQRVVAGCGCSPSVHTFAHFLFQFFERWLD